MGLNVNTSSRDETLNVRGILPGPKATAWKDDTGMTNAMSFADIEE